MSKLTRIITGGTGLIGQALINRWLKQRFNLILVTQDISKAKQIFPSLEHIITWDELNQEYIGSAECIINLAGENIGHKPWTEAQKAKIMSSRIETTLRIANLCTELGPNSPRLFNASAIGIYGLHKGKKNKLGKVFSEEKEFEPGTDFLSEVATKWEQATQPAQQAGVNVIQMRFGVVLSDQGGALPEFTRMAKSFLACPIGSGNQPFSWIHIFDVCAAIEALLQHPEISGPVNFVSPEPLSQGKFLKSLCEILHKPYWPNAPWKKLFNYALQKMLGTEKADCLLNYGQHVKPHVLTKIHFDHSYRDIKTALKQIYH